MQSPRDPPTTLGCFWCGAEGRFEGRSFFACRRHAEVKFNFERHTAHVPPTHPSSRHSVSRNVGSFWEVALDAVLAEIIMVRWGHVRAVGRVRARGVPILYPGRPRLRGGSLRCRAQQAGPAKTTLGDRVRPTFGPYGEAPEWAAPPQPR